MESDSRCIRASLDMDLSLFSSYLHSKGVRHRIYRESHAQVLELEDERLSGDVQAAFEAWRDGRPTRSPTRSSGSSTGTSGTSAGRNR